MKALTKNCHRVAWMMATALIGIAANARADDKALYVEKIKPLLRERCYACHGALKQKAQLRVDTAQQIIDADIIENGKLLARLVSNDLDERMPPEGEALHAEEIAAIRKWLEAGAPAPEGENAEDDPRAHWAFQRIERPEVPGIAGAVHPIDAYLAAKHTKHNLKAQPAAERSLLLRRLYLDLIGLPPTPEQLKDSRDLEKIIDELLASPHYGERWGRHWMDVWRYSDWYGLGAQLRNSQKNLWRWRDWIVNSLNDDKGYDRMVHEMLAGDELDPENLDVVAGTGFLTRNYYLFNRTTWLDDTIEHTGKAFLGLTMNCAKCHDHKYDPIEHTDYYRFRAIFEPHQVRLDALPGLADYANDGLPRAFDDHLDAKTFLHQRGDPASPDKSKIISAGVPAIFADAAPQPEAIELPVFAWAPGLRDYVQKDQLAAARTKLSREKDALAKAKAQLSTPSKVRPAPASLLAYEDDFSTARPKLWLIDGSGWRYQGGSLVQLESNREKQYARMRQPHSPDFDLSVNFRTTGGDTYKSVGIRFDLIDEGRNAHTVYTSAHAAGPKVQVAHTRDGASSYPRAGKVSHKIETNHDYQLDVRVRGNLINVSLDGEFLIAYQLPYRNPEGVIELFAFDATAEFESFSLKPLDPDIEMQPAKASDGSTVPDREAALKIAEARVTEAETALGSLEARIAADRQTHLGKKSDKGPKEAALQERIHTLAKARLELLTAEAGKKKAAEKAITTAEKALKTDDDSKADYSSVRGSFKAKETPEHSKQLYEPTYSKISTGRRTALAKWIISRDNPLAARVAVNHIWMRHFGTPIVEKVFDFGRQSTRPEHAALLDFLAVELIDSGWSMKHLHRLILTSQAWQRTSSNLNADDATFAADPTNQFYWRMNPRRMESQLIRDSLLSQAGVLDLEMGGPSIKPGVDIRRRSLYLNHSRESNSLLLTTFDDADVLACYRRSESIVPQQALALANSALSLEMCEQIAATTTAGSDDREFARTAFAKILCRPASKSELAECTKFLAEVPNRARLIHALVNHNDHIMIR